MELRERLKAWLSTWILEPLLLQKAEQAARAQSPDHHTRLNELVIAARQREGVAREIRDDASLASALSLLREAVALSASAALVAGPEPEVGALQAAEAAARLDRLVESGALPGAAEPLNAFKSVLVDSDPLALDRLPAEEANQARSAGERLVSILLRPIETRTVRAIRVQRVLRIGLVALGVCAAIWVLVTSAFEPRNMALHKPVTASSRYPNTPECTGLVDGSKSGPYGCHTGIEQNPWVAIDLQKPYSIREIIVYNRSDGWQEDVLPLTLELSEDGRTFQEVGNQTTLFTDSKPWKLQLNGRSARYVRLTVKRRSYIALHEVEVFAR